MFNCFVLFCFVLFISATQPERTSNPSVKLGAGELTDSYSSLVITFD
jgi:hypothetical protein